MHQKSYNYKVYFGISNRMIMYHVKSTNLPKYDVQINEDLLGDTNHKSSGKGTWNDLEITFYDIQEMDANGDTYISEAKMLFHDLCHEKGIRMITGNKNFGISDGNHHYVETAEGNHSYMTLGQIIIEKIYGNKTKMASNASDDLSTEQIKTRVQPTGEHYSEFWVLDRPILKGVDYGEGDYSSEDLNTITAVFSYSHAKLVSSL